MESQQTWAVNVPQRDREDISDNLQVILTAQNTVKAHSMITIMSPDSDLNRNDLNHFEPKWRGKNQVD